jgi:YesN/AraC family two-component response regulator
VKNIVELHKGKVFAQSEVGKGSKFTIQLPLGQSHFSSEQVIHDFKNSEDESHYKIRPSVMRNTNIAFPDVSVEKMKNEKLQRLLIVEDNPEIRSFIKETFVKHFNILEAENGQVGLNLANKYIPDLIISDVMMPEMDGITLCRYIKENDNTAHIPFIVLTARTGNVFKVEGYHSGADAYVTKPFHPSVLRAQVDSLLISRKKMKEYFGKMITLQPRDIEISSLDAKFLTKVLNLVEDNLDNESLSRDFLASSMAMSPSSLYRKLKSLTDLTTNAFIRSVRLKRAAQMMQNTQYNVSEIAFEVGFNDLKYFRKCFRDQFGVNPSDYIHENSLSATHSDN